MHAFGCGLNRSVAHLCGRGERRCIPRTPWQKRVDPAPHRLRRRGVRRDSGAALCRCMIAGGVLCDERRPARTLTRRVVLQPEAEEALVFADWYIDADHIRRVLAPIAEIVTAFNLQR